MMAGGARDARARRDAKRQGLYMKKSRKYGYFLIDPYTNFLVAGDRTGGLAPWDIEEIEEWLSERLSE